jgi:SNF2 family DNA or RNA helicase
MAAPIPRYKVRLHQANGETSSRGGLAENQKFHDIRLQRAQQKSDLYIEDLPHLHLPSNISDRLFDHQRYGVNWMYHLHLAKTGGILGDDMGLGKTFQVVSLMVGLMLKREIQKVLIAAPVSVLPNWQREIETHLLPHVPATTHILNSDMAKRKRLSILSEVFFDNNHQIIISSHQMITNMIEDFTQGSWDYVILDEGHVIKNPSTKMFKAMKSLKTKHRLLLTGTPIQNKLEEFWAVVDWATEGRAFGTLSNFTKMIADPIAKGQHPNATEFQLIVANEARDLLTRATKPILLQRKKKEQPKETLQLPEKKELVLWISLSTQQRNIYEKYMYSTTYSRAFSRSTYPVEVITYLKSLCRHPVLLEVAERKRKTEDLDDLVHSLQTLTMNEETTPENNYEDYGVGHLFDAIARVPTAEELLRGSVKLRVLVKMITALTDEGHRILVFSQSKLMLQIIQYVLIAFDFASYKIDGSMNARERQQIIDDFNNISEDYSGPLVCLLTTKACGCGITLTAADRVIIFDPCKS